MKHAWMLVAGVIVIACAVASAFVKRPKMDRHSLEIPEVKRARQIYSHDNNGGCSAAPGTTDKYGDDNCGP